MDARNTRREFLRKSAIAATGAAAWIHSHVAGAPVQQTRRPNIMLIIADDLTCRDCEPYGSTEVRTPNLARFAREGIVFDAMFTSTAMCAPTRQQLYTGLYPVRNGAFPNHSWVYDGVKSIVHHLGGLGYRVGLAGKTHFGPPESFPFEIVGTPGADVNPKQVRAIRDFVNRDNDQPYCLIVCSHQPHKPWNQGDASAYDPKDLTVPPYLVDCAETREALSQYYAEVSFFDAQLGECLKVVDESGRKDDTIVLFTSEQGAQLPFGKWTCYDIGLKTGFIVRWPGVVQPGTRTDAMVQYVDVLPTLIEAAGGDPTAIDTGRPDAGGNRGFDGRSFLGVLRGRADAFRDYVYGVQTTRGIIEGSECYPIRSVRSSRYKYIRNLNHDAPFSNLLTSEKDSVLHAWLAKGKDDPKALARAQFYIHRPAEELYDLQADPFELKNRADDPALAEIKKDLARRLELWTEQQGDKGIETEMQAQQRKGTFLRKARRRGRIRTDPGQ